jgi:hypothetical protein
VLIVLSELIFKVGDGGVLGELGGVVKLLLDGPAVAEALDLGGGAAIDFGDFEACSAPGRSGGVESMDGGGQFS